MGSYNKVNYSPGDRYGRLVLVEFIRKNENRQIIWKCRCDCGNEKEYRIGDVKVGRTRSCGCLYTEARGQATITHGKTKTPEYVTWTAIIHRTTNPKSSNWAIYGGRGITICDRWRDSFEAFLEDVGEKPSKKHSIDRIDNDGNYEPGNVRWATRKEQRENQSSSRYAHVVVPVGNLTDEELAAKTPAVIAILTKLLHHKVNVMEFEVRLHTEAAIFKLDRGAKYRPVERKTGNVKVGEHYNHLTAVKYLGIDDGRQRVWEWVCDCGRSRIGRASRVRYGEIKDCGWGCGLKK